LASSYIGDIGGFLTSLVLFRVAGGKPAASAQFLLNPDSSARSQQLYNMKAENKGLSKSIKR
jgi:hypothetical protein